MTDVAAMPEPFLRREIARWGICFLLVLMIHGGGAVALFMQRDRGDMGEASPMIAEFITLPDPTAPPRDIAPGREQVQSEAAPLINVKMPDVVREIDVSETRPMHVAEAKPIDPVPEAKPAPIRDVKPIEKDERPPSPDPVPIPDLVPVQDAEVTLASLAPPPPPPPVEEKKEDEPEVVKTAVPVAPSIAVAVTTAPTSATINNASLVSWRSKLATHLQRYKRYPAAAQSRRQQGTALIQFTVNRAGRVVTANLQKSSGFVALDEETVALLRRAEPLPRPPADVAGGEFTFSVPVQFRVR